MKKPVEVIFYDGEMATPIRAFIVPQDNHYIVLSWGDDQQQKIRYQDMGFSGAVGHCKAVIELPNDQRIEFLKHVPHWFNLKQKSIYHFIWQLERSPLLILFAFMVTLALAFSAVKWLIPQLADVIAHQLSDNTMQKVGDESERYTLAKTKPSTLSAEHQARIKQRYLNELKPDHPANIVFRLGGEMGSNALAIPNNTIILTDELVKMAGTDEEVLAVLAHEQGHLAEKHSLQKAIATVGVVGIWTILTGDSSDVVTGMSLGISNAHYSRQLESKADVYAIALLEKNQLSPIHLANFLQRTANVVTAQENQDVLSGKYNPQDIQNQTWAKQLKHLLASHPETEARIQAIYQHLEQNRQP